MFVCDKVSLCTSGWPQIVPSQTPECCDHRCVPPMPGSLLATVIILWKLVPSLGMFSIEWKLTKHFLFKIFTFLFYYTDLGKDVILWCVKWISVLTWPDQATEPDSWGMMNYYVLILSSNISLLHSKADDAQQEALLVLWSQGIYPNLVWGMVYFLLTECSTISATTRNLRRDFVYY